MHFRHAIQTFTTLPLHTHAKSKQSGNQKVIHGHWYIIHFFSSRLKYMVDDTIDLSSSHLGRKF
jgi:hypothetical protein